MKEYHIVYRTHNLINGKEYTGKHSTNNLNDRYYGSGKGLFYAVAKYGLENFAVEILSFHETEQEALEEELRIVDEEYVWRDDTYNQTIGGKSNWYGLTTVKDKNGNKFQVSKYDPRYLSGELVGIAKNMVSVKDKDGNTFQVAKDDPRFLSGELVHVGIGLTNPGLNKGMVSVKDKDGNTFQVAKDDPRFLSGELVGSTKGQINVKDKDGNILKVSVDDPRYLSGELVGILKGHKFNKKDPIIKCPYCNKSGAPCNMKRWHFDNCKLKP